MLRQFSEALAKRVSEKKEEIEEHESRYSDREEPENEDKDTLIKRLRAEHDKNFQRKFPFERGQYHQVSPICLLIQSTIVHSKSQSAWRVHHYAASQQSDRKLYTSVIER